MTRQLLRGAAPCVAVCPYGDPSTGRVSIDGIELTCPCDESLMRAFADHYGVVTVEDPQGGAPRSYPTLNSPDEIMRAGHLILVLIGLTPFGPSLAILQHGNLIVLLETELQALEGFLGRDLEPHESSNARAATARTRWHYERCIEDLAVMPSAENCPAPIRQGWHPHHWYLWYHLTPWHGTFREIDDFVSFNTVRFAKKLGLTNEPAVGQLQLHLKAVLEARTWDEQAQERHPEERRDWTESAKRASKLSLPRRPSR